MTALPSKVDGTSTVKVQGEEVQVDRARLVVDECNIDAELDQLPALISYWGEMWATAEQELMEADAFYRNWRARLGEKLLKKNPKLSEWKIKQAIEAAPMFVQLKNGLAQGNRNAIMLMKHANAFAEKGNMLYSKVKHAAQRAEADAADVHTRPEGHKEKQEAVIGERIAAMKKTFKDKKGS